MVYQTQFLFIFYILFNVLCSPLPLSCIRVRDFEFTGELCVFDLLGIMLYHGWVVDPSSEVAPVITDLSYNQLTNNIFAWREEAVKNNNNDLLVKGEKKKWQPVFAVNFCYYTYTCICIFGSIYVGAAVVQC